MLRHLIGVALVTTAVGLAAAGPAGATSVAYVDGDQVWVAATDGSSKHQLSRTVGVDRWNSVAQSDGGFVVGVRNEPGKIASLSSFELWRPDGRSAGSGPLTGEPGWQTYAYPVGLDLTPDGSVVAYGYSNSRFAGSFQFDAGTYLLSTRNRSTTPPTKLSGLRWPTLGPGRRLVATQDGSSTVLQAASSGAPFSGDVAPWGVTGYAGYDTHRSDVSADGRVLAVEFVRYEEGSSEVLDGKIAVFPISALGGAIDDERSCFLPTTGPADDVSLSQDGRLIAWHDDRGVVVAGVPTFADTSAEATCALTKAPTTISRTGTTPSLGSLDARALDPAPAEPDPTPVEPGSTTPATPGGTTPTTTTSPATPTAPAVPPAAGGPAPGIPVAPTGGTAPSTTPAVVQAATALRRVTVAALRRGIPLTVRARRKGAVRLALTVPARVLGLRGKARVVARARATATTAGSVRVTLRATALGRARAAKLVGARATLRITAGGRTTSRAVVIR